MIKTANSRFDTELNRKLMRKFNEYSTHRPYDVFKVDVNLEEAAS
jgi:hypothetical protein